MSEKHFTKATGRIAQEVVQTGIDKPDLRDELYCQLIKQTTLNTNPYVIFIDLHKFNDVLYRVSCKKAWELLSLCSSCFTPSENLIDYLLAYFQVNTNWQGDTRSLAIDSLRRIQFTLQYHFNIISLCANPNV